MVANSSGSRGEGTVLSLFPSDLKNAYDIEVIEEIALKTILVVLSRAPCFPGLDPS